MRLLLLVLLEHCTSLSDLLYWKLIRAKAVKCNLVKFLFVGRPLTHHKFLCNMWWSNWCTWLLDEKPECCFFVTSRCSLRSLSATKEMLCLHTDLMREHSLLPLNMHRMCLQQIHSLVIKMGLERSVYCSVLHYVLLHFHGVLSDPWF